MSREWTAQEIPDQHGRTAIVTGANSGLGRIVARELARHGAHVIIATRDRAKGAEAATAIKAAFPAGRTRLLALGSLRTIQARQPSLRLRAR
jgi:NAD(P)-dependent dehydrogenase (short-subunit alcohol dehydrogenase family)